MDEEGKAIDPRTELVQRLLEYRRYKAVLEELRDLEQARAARQARGNVTEELQQAASQALADAELENLTLFRVLKAYEQVMANFEFRNEKTSHTVTRVQYTLEERRDYLMQRLGRSDRLGFQQVFEACENRLHAIFTFLAILDLMQQERIIFTGGEGFNDFSLQAALLPSMSAHT